MQPRTPVQQLERSRSCESRMPHRGMPQTIRDPQTGLDASRHGWSNVVGVPRLVVSTGSEVASDFLYPPLFEQ
jgi:hypothetical protein